MCGGVGARLRGPTRASQLTRDSPSLHLHVATIKVHPSDHAALGGHVRPVDHLLSVVKVQSNSIVQALVQKGHREVSCCGAHACLGKGVSGEVCLKSTWLKGEAVGDNQGPKWEELGRRYWTRAVVAVRKAWVWAPA